MTHIIKYLLQSLCLLMLKANKLVWWTYKSPLCNFSLVRQRSRILWLWCCKIWWQRPSLTCSAAVLYTISGMHTCQGNSLLVVQICVVHVTKRNSLLVTSVNMQVSCWLQLSEVTTISKVSWSTCIHICIWWDRIFKCIFAMPIYLPF